ncbi:MAG: M23 family metallopeptidase [Myxococcota bacterium]
MVAPLDPRLDAPPCTGDAFARNGGCADLGDAALDPTLAWLPFTAGREVRVGQGFHGPLSHTGAAAYAVDFPVPEGTLVRAARAGRVASLREDSDAGCGDPSCAPLANSVVVDHGDGTFATYLHLQRDGVLVSDGDIVARGQPIARSGTTGFSTGPHLHLEVRDILGQSQPLRFAEFEATGGTPYTGVAVTSANEEQPPPDAIGWSTCPPDLFAFLGVLLEPGLSCSRVEGRSVLRGEVLVPGAAAAVFLLDDAGLDRICAPPGPFEVEVPWDALGYAGPAMFAVSAAAPDDCVPFRGTAVGALVDVR